MEGVQGITTIVRKRWTCAVVRTALLALGVLCASAPLSACYRPLLSPDEPRSQYDRSAAIRDRRAPSYVEDEYGNRQPNLRGRLLGGI
jgi:hypothetical protein